MDDKRLGYDFRPESFFPTSWGGEYTVVAQKSIFRKKKSEKVANTGTSPRLATCVISTDIENPKNLGTRVITPFTGHGHGMLQ